MHLISILLPLYDNDGQPFRRDLLRDVAAQLMKSFGGLTAHTRAPAQGLWQAGDVSSPVRDDIVIYEVMVEAVDRQWWAAVAANSSRGSVRSTS